MKRFYCTVCQKVKRVRNYPQVMDNYAAMKPEDRIGQCDRHADKFAQVNRQFRAGYKAKVGA